MDRTEHDKENVFMVVDENKVTHLITGSQEYCSYRLAKNTNIYSVCVIVFVSDSHKEFPVGDEEFC